MLRIALDAWWLSEFRRDYPLNIDEIIYSTMALDDTRAFKAGGLVGLSREFVAKRSHNAPLVPLLTVPIHLVFGAEIFPSLFVEACFLVLLALASYGLAGEVASRPLALLAAIVVTCIPDITDWARTYMFAVPCAALFTASAYALVRSEGLLRRRWSLAWGFLLGLTLLARTMTIAWVPASSSPRFWPPRWYRRCGERAWQT